MVCNIQKVIAYPLLGYLFTLALAGCSTTGNQLGIGGKIKNSYPQYKSEQTHASYPKCLKPPNKITTEFARKDAEKRCKWWGIDEILKDANLTSYVDQAIKCFDEKDRDYWENLKKFGRSKAQVPLNCKLCRHLLLPMITYKVQLGNIDQIREQYWNYINELNKQSPKLKSKSYKNMPFIPINGIEKPTNGIEKPTISQINLQILWAQAHRLECLKQESSYQQPPNREQHHIRAAAADALIVAVNDPALPVDVKAAVDGNNNALAASPASPDPSAAVGDYAHNPPIIPTTAVEHHGYDPRTTACQSFYAAQFIS